MPSAQTLPVLHDSYFNVIAHRAFERTPAVVGLIWVNAP